MNRRILALFGDISFKFWMVPIVVTLDLETHKISSLYLKFISYRMSSADGAKLVDHPACLKTII